PHDGVGGRTLGAWRRGTRVLKGPLRIKRLRRERDRRRKHNLGRVGIGYLLLAAYALALPRAGDRERERYRRVGIERAGGSRRERIEGKVKRARGARRHLRKSGLLRGGPLQGRVARLIKTVGTLDRGGAEHRAVEL